MHVMRMAPVQPVYADEFEKANSDKLYDKRFAQNEA